MLVGKTWSSTHVPVDLWSDEEIDEWSEGKEKTSR